MLVYKARQGAGFGNEKAEKYGKELDRLHNKHGLLKPEVVVKEAIKQSNPLHNYFEWDNEKASNNYRTWQARQLHKSILVIEVNEEEEEISKPQILYVNIKDGDQQGYEPLQKALQIKSHRDYLLTEVYGKLKRIREQYHQLKELSKVFEEIDSLQLTL